MELGLGGPHQLEGLHEMQGKPGIVSVRGGVDGNTFRKRPQIWRLSPNIYIYRQIDRLNELELMESPRRDEIISAI